MLSFSAIVLLGLVGSPADFQIASGGEAKCVIVSQAGATEAERYAANELAKYLEQATGAKFRIVGSVAPSEPAIVVGPGPEASRLFPADKLDRLAPEETLAKTRDGNLLIAGGRPRGTLYAVYRFLYKKAGIRWWTPWATKIPRTERLTIAATDESEVPAFEYREPFWFAAFDGDWAARNYSNGSRPNLEARHGGKISYKGFVHTFYSLVPPEQYFATHPEWFSLINGKRTWQNAQLCTTNPALRDFLVEQVRKWLRETPSARIVSVSQNDWFGSCECDQCKALDAREGSPAGAMVALANYIGEKIEREFPDVAIDTLAYQYTRKPPKTIRPRKNVIVRLCSIEANFARPLEDPSNAGFADDLRAWGKITDRLYVWDYVTDFRHYQLPFPNWGSIGPNIRFFKANGVRGLFEEGAYESNGASMAEMEAWVQAQLMWDPKQDDRALIREFVEGYYGRDSAPYIESYMKLMELKSRDYYLTCFTELDAPFLDFETLSEADRLWGEAESRAENADFRWRIRKGRLAVRYAILAAWPRLRREGLRSGLPWPGPARRSEAARAWLDAATEPGPPGWKPITTIREGALTPEAFASQMSADLPDPAVQVLPKRPASVPLPNGIQDGPGVVDLQDDRAFLARDGVWAEPRPDPQASDGIAIWMPATHKQWAAGFRLASVLGYGARRTFRVYATVRVDKAPGAAGLAFNAGAYDEASRRQSNDLAVKAEDAPSGYKLYALGEVAATRATYIWFAPSVNPSVNAVYVDRVILVPVDPEG